MNIVGYTYEADCHCVPCAQKRSNAGGFRKSHPEARADIVDAHGLPLTATDNEGNPIHPMFSTDEQLEPQLCGDCRERIE